MNFVSLQVDDKDWHKIDLSVRRDRVTLFIDCQPHGIQPIDIRRPIDVNGEITIAKFDDQMPVQVIFNSFFFVGKVIIKNIVTLKRETRNLVPKSVNII